MMFLRSFKKELLAYILVLVFTTIVLTTAIGIFSTKTAGNSAADATSAVLRTQAEELLVQIAAAAAQSQDLLFEEIGNNTKTIGVFTANVYDNPSLFSMDNYWDFESRVMREGGLYVNNESDISTFHIPSFVELDEDEKGNIELTSALDFFVPSIMDKSEGSVAIYVIDKEGVTRYFPNIILGKLGPPDYDPRGDIYYLPANPENNPEKKLVWSELYDDVAGRGLMITATAPVYTKDGFAGIAATDVLLKSIIEKIITYSPIEGSYLFLINGEGVTIAFPDKAYEDILGRSREEGETKINLFEQELHGGFETALKEMTSGSTGFTDFFSADEGHLLMAYSPLEQTGFNIGIVAEEEVALRAVRTLRANISDSIRDTIMTLILPASIFIIFIALIIGLFIANQVVGPVQELTKGVRQISKGNLNYDIKVKSSNEIGELSRAFKRMSRNLKESRQKLHEYSQGLEEQVKERTKELTAANSRLRELDRLKSEFISIASHQLRTPLTATKGYVSLLLDGTYGALSDKVASALKMVYESNERLVRLVDDLLNISRMERGKLHYRLERISLIDLLNSVVKELTIAAETKKLKIIYNVRDYDGKFTISADAEKLRQVFLNILDNSIKYTQKGHIDIKVMKDTKPGYISVSIRDTGIGISPKDQKLLFGQFIRGERGSRVSVSGLGIGLYIARRIVEDHGGQISVESEGAGKGSTFTMILPVARKKTS